MRAADLKQVQFFHNLDESYLGEVARACKEEYFGGGTPIFHEGEEGQKLYLILEGQIRISRQIPGAGEEALAILDAGQAFGEMALIDATPRSADAISHSSCRLATLSRSDFEELLFANKHLAYHLLWNLVRMLSARLRETNEKLKGLLAMTGMW